MRHESTINLKAIKFFRKIDKVFDSLILRGSSFDRRQIRTKKEFLKTSVLLKGTTVSQQFDTRANRYINENI